MQNGLLQLTLRRSYIHLTKEACCYSFFAQEKLYQISEAVKNVKIKGIDDIERAVLNKTSSGKWEIVTEGSNLKEVIKVNGVDCSRVTTNNIIEISNVLGVEAARQAIINEACGTLSEAGLDVEKLGRKRITNFRNSLVKSADEERGFADKRKDKSLQAPLSTEAQMAKRIRELEHRNAYLEQENDFLKKIQELEKACGGKAVKPK